jgi:acyl CoA:acetate/3-ketoacid CoA transferase alpha subunit
MNKFVSSAEQSINDIADGASVAISGFGLAHRFPNTLIYALRDKGVRDLTLVCNSLGAPREMIKLKRSLHPFRYVLVWKQKQKKESLQARSRLN